MVLSRIGDYAPCLSTLRRDYKQQSFRAISPSTKLLPSQKFVWAGLAVRLASRTSLRLSIPHAGNVDCLLREHLHALRLLRCSREESNLYCRLRKPVSYPLNDESNIRMYIRIRATPPPDRRMYDGAHLRRHGGENRNTLHQHQLLQAELLSAARANFQS